MNVPLFLGYLSLAFSIGLVSFRSPKVSAPNLVFVFSTPADFILSGITTRAFQANLLPLYALIAIEVLIVAPLAVVLLKAAAMERNGPAALERQNNALRPLRQRVIETIGKIGDAKNDT